VTAALRSEWRKLAGTRSLVVLVVLALAAAVGLAILVTLVVPTDQLRRDELADPVRRSQLLMGGMGIARFLLGSLGVLIIGQEFRSNTIRVTFAAEPRRGRVLAAKAVLVGAVGAVVSAAGVALAAVAGGAILSAKGVGVPLTDATVLRSFVGWGAVSAVYGLGGLALGALLRQPVGGIVALVVWRLLVESILAAVFPDVGGWLPFTAGDRVAAVVPDDAAGPPGWWGFAYLCVVLAVVGAVGTALIRRRDA
jgi:ABC-2 type transport system permease protein